MMMVILGCTQAIGTTPEKKSCSAKCAPGCVFANLAYPICYAICMDKCKRGSPPTLYDDCFNSCIATKFTPNNIGIQFLITLISFIYY